MSLPGFLIVLAKDWEWEEVKSSLKAEAHCLRNALAVIKISMEFKDKKRVLSLWVASPLISSTFQGAA